MKHRIQQFLYELVYARHICCQWDYMHKTPYNDGFNAGMRSVSKQIRLMIKTCAKDQIKYPKAVTDKFIIQCIESCLIPER